jgi:integrase
MADAALVRVKPAECSLPDQVRTRAGVMFDPGLDVWEYRDHVKNVSINFSELHRVLSDRMRYGLKRTLIWYTENRAPSHLMNLFARFRHMIDFLSVARAEVINEITDVDLLNYRASLNPATAWYFGSITGLLKRWYGMSLPGVSESAFALLNTLRVRGNQKGEAVLTMDPEAGPFTDIELVQIQSTLNAAFAAGKVSEDEYLLAWLFMALGQRPSQYAALKVRDLLTVNQDGESEYILRVPRVKQRNAGPRVEFKERPLIRQIGDQLFNYSRRVRRRYEGILADPDDAPMFPVSAGSAGGARWASGYEYHQTGGGLSQNLANTLRRLSVQSERTGAHMNITPIRFRRTFGTRAAQEGHGELVIAELLDHSDTQNVGVYVAAVPEIAARIDRAVAMQLAPLAQAFKGMLIQNESEATRGTDPSSRIIDARIDRSLKPMGSCGQHSFCGFNAPIACYTCQHFQPWLDGPHEAVLDHLLQKREQLLATTDQRMAAVNDSTIFAVAQVIQLCRQARAGEAVENG